MNLPGERMTRDQKGEMASVCAGTGLGCEGDKGLRWQGLLPVLTHHCLYLSAITKTQMRNIVCLQEKRNLLLPHFSIFSNFTLQTLSQLSFLQREKSSRCEGIFFLKQ